MTKSMRVALAGLIIGVAVQPVLAADEEVGRPLRFSVGAYVAPTDNRSYSEHNKKSNTDIFVSPRVDYVYNDGKNKVNFFYMPSFRYRTSVGDSDDTGWFQDLGLKSTIAFSERSRLRFNEEYSYNDESAIVAGGAVEQGNHTFGENTVELGYNVDLYRYNNLDFVVKNNIKRFSDDNIAQASDESVSTGEIAHRYQITETMRSFLAGTVGYVNYNDDLNLDRDFYSLIAKVGLENSFTPSTFGRLILGYQDAEYDSNAMGSKSEPYAKLSVDTQTGADLSVGAAYGHGIRDTDAYPYTSQVYDEFDIHGHLKIAPNLGLRAMGIYRMSSYDRDDLTPQADALNLGNESGGDVTTIVFDALLDYALLENVSLYAGYRYEDVDSDVGGTYTKNTGRFGAAYKF